MKKSIYILSILILFQSCYSYKTFDVKDYETIKPKKVKIELNNSGKIKGKVIEYKRNNFVIKTKNKTVNVLLSRAIEAKVKEHLWLETTILSVSAFFVTLGYIFYRVLTNL
ncbi:hypothetical protein [Polaribacter aestuariivivens]|uniref:hypothetical protein n=1 Tax=Polaribacter aestuariivivens TaxID=2304626 RepID=UPI003F499927